MNLLWVRQQFIDKTGRMELATTTNQDYDTDAGADFYINGGIRDLDLAQVVKETIAQQNSSFAIGAYEILLRNARFIRRVYYTDADGKMKKLTYKTLEWIMDEYPALWSTDSGTPLYWTEVIERQAPVGGRSLEYRKLCIMPPTDAAITLNVFGGFFSTWLENNDDENYWTINHPNLVVTAAMRNLEGIYRNTQGFDDYDAIVGRYLEGVEFDEIEDERNDR